MIYDYTWLVQLLTEFGQKYPVWFDVTIGDKLQVLVIHHRSLLRLPVLPQELKLIPVVIVLTAILRRSRSQITVIHLLSLPPRVPHPVIPNTPAPSVLIRIMAIQPLPQAIRTRLR